jgi:hypothetical protein
MRSMIKRLPLLLAACIAAAVSGDAGWTRLAATARAEAPNLPPQFTAASLKGTCGFNTASTDVDPLSSGFLHPTSSFGTLVFDGSSSVTGTVTINRSGKLLTTSTAVGSYSVGADGRTGTMDFTAHGGSSFTFVIVSGGAAIRYMNTGPVDPTSGIVDAVTIATCKF